MRPDSAVHLDVARFQPQEPLDEALARWAARRNDHLQRLAVIDHLQNGVAGIEAQIHQHLAHLSGVGLDQPEILGLACLQSDAWIEGALDQSDDFLDGLVEEVRFGPQDRLA